MYFVKLTKTYFSPGERAIFQTFSDHSENGLESRREKCGGVTV